MTAANPAIRFFWDLHSTLYLIYVYSKFSHTVALFVTLQCVQVHSRFLHTRWPPRKLFFWPPFVTRLLTPRSRKSGYGLLLGCRSGLHRWWARKLGHIQACPTRFLAQKTFVILKNRWPNKNLFLGRPACPLDGVDADVRKKLWKRAFCKKHPRGQSDAKRRCVARHVQRGHGFPHGHAGANNLFLSCASK